MISSLLKPFPELTGVGLNGEESGGLRMNCGRIVLGASLSCLLWFVFGCASNLESGRGDPSAQPGAEYPRSATVPEVSLPFATGFFQGDCLRIVSSDASKKDCEKAVLRTQMPGGRSVYFFKYSENQEISTVAFNAFASGLPGIFNVIVVTEKSLSSGVVGHKASGQCVENSKARTVECLAKLENGNSIRYALSNVVEVK